MFGSPVLFGVQERIDVTRLISASPERALKFRRVNPPRGKVGKGD